MSGPDVSVRIAWADDAAAVAGLQVLAWRRRFAALGDDGVALPEPADVARAWADALARPADARQRVLVALERARVTGFAVLGPATDPDRDPVADGEVSEFVVDEAETGRGHGSRLLQAIADTLRADRFTHAVAWVDAADDALRTFLTDAGWATDGAHRTLDGPVEAKQVRLHTALA